MMKLFPLSIVLLCAISACISARAAVIPSGDHAQAETALDIVRRAEARSEAKEWKEAAALWAQAVEANPVNGEYWSQLGQARYSARDYAAAIPAYEKTLELRQGYPFTAAYNIACCLALQGEKEKALQWLSRAMDMGFRDLHLVQTDDDLKSLHGDARFTKLAALADVSKMSRDEAWRYDLWLLAREAKRIHYKPLTHEAEIAIETFVKDLHDRIPQLTDNQITVGFMRLMRLFGDAHTSIRPTMARPALPVQFYLFQEGLFIIAADPKYADLAGAQVLEIGSHPIEAVMAALDPVISQDNVMWPKLIGPNLMRYPQALNGLGLIPDADKAVLKIRDSRGGEREVTLSAEVGDPNDNWSTARKDTSGPEPLYLKNQKAPYWFEYLPETKTVYFQYNAVQDDPQESLEKFCDRLFRYIDANDVHRLVIDMRWNGGGNNFLNAPIIRGLIRCDKINQQGKLFVIVGRNTFSAAMCGAAQIERYSNAIFVGEPTGSRPNFVGETIRVDLPYSKMRASISDLYWQNSVAMDYRTWIAPTLYAPPTFALYRAKRDPAMEAIATYPLDK
jgi:tetratricopeptide (TPR) repeat protein